MNKKSIFISNLAWQSNKDKLVLKKLKEYNFSGIDFAPLQITNNWNNITHKVRKYSAYLKKNKIKVNAIQGIFFKKKINIFKQESNFYKIVKHLRIIIKLCRILECNKIIIGSTSFRDKSNLDKKKADEIFCQFLKHILPLLQKNKIFFCLETIPKQYNEKYLYNFKDVVNIIKKINSKWIAINYDTSIFHYKKMDLIQFNQNLKLIKNIQISQKKFNFFVKPSKVNIKFCNIIKKNYKIKDISFEIISKKTNLSKLNLSIVNINKLLN